MYYYTNTRYYSYYYYLLRFLQGSKEIKYMKLCGKVLGKIHLEKSNCQVAVKYSYAPHNNDALVNNGPLYRGSVVFTMDLKTSYYLICHSCHNMEVMHYSYVCDASSCGCPLYINLAHTRCGVG